MPYMSYDLLDALCSGDTEQVEALLNEGRSPTLPDRTGRTPMHYAAELGDEGAMVSLLQAYGATGHVIPPEGQTYQNLPLVPIAIAIAQQNPRTLEMLLTDDQAKQMIAHRDVRGEGPLEWCVRWAEESKGQTPVNFSSLTRCIEILLDSDAQPVTSDTWPGLLRLALQDANARLVQRLLTEGDRAQVDWLIHDVRSSFLEDLLKGIAWRSTENPRTSLPVLFALSEQMLDKGFSLPSHLPKALDFHADQKALAEELLNLLTKRTLGDQWILSADSPSQSRAIAKRF